MVRAKLLASGALLAMVSLCCSFGGSDEEEREEEAAAEPPAPPTVPFAQAVLGADGPCETLAEPSAFEDIEALYAAPSPAPIQKLRERCGPAVVFYLEYPDEDAARHAVLRMAGAVFHGSRPIVTRPNEVLRRGPVVAFVISEYGSDVPTQLIELRQFRIALEGRTRVGIVMRGADPFGGAFTNSGTELSGTRMLRAGWACESAPDRGYCAALDRYEDYRSVDPPRDFPLVHLGRCLDVTHEHRERLCTLLWSPLGVELVAVTDEDLAPAEQADALARLARGEAPSAAALAFADSVIDRGPGRTTDVRHRTRRAPPIGERVTYIRGTEEEIIAVETVRHSTRAELVAVFAVR